MKRTNSIFYVFFFLSGATALVYEVIWARILQLTFGSTIYAITTVLTAFMAGLAIGSYFMGRYAEKRRNPLLMYALLEIGIGIYAILAPIFLELTDALYLTYYHVIWQQQQLLFVVRFLHSFVVLLVPTIFMGATLPVLSKYLITSFSKFGKTLSLLYAVNTFGAMIGTAFVGFYSLPALGLMKSNYIAAACNIIIGILSFLFWRMHKHTAIANAASTEIETQAVSPSDTAILADSSDPKKVMLYVKILLLVSGYAAMAYEILWTRTLELFINSTTYSFSIILVTYLMGIALGSFLNSVLFKGRLNKVLHLSLLQLLIGLFAFICFPVFTFIPRLVLIIWELAPGSYFYNSLAKLLCSLIIMLIPTICMGMTFPIAAEIYSTYKRKISKDVGTAYAYTTWGNILGSFITGVFMVSLLGIQNNMKICIIMNIALAVAGIFLFYNQGMKLSYTIGITAAFLIIIVPMYPTWSPYILDSGVFIYQDKYKQSSLFEETAKDWNIIYYKEGLNALITVRKSNDLLLMRTNGKSDASNLLSDMHSQLLAGYLPLMLKPEAKNILAIGLGSGITTGTLIQHPSLESLDCIEIEKSVLECAQFFNYYNKNVLSNPKMHVYIEDGMSFLKSTKQRYDIISVHLSNPWIAGIANLYTYEAYELMKSKLADDGIVLQWVQTYRVSPDLMKMAIRTFSEAFPYHQLWADGPVVYLIGGKKPIPRYNEKFFTLAKNSPAIRDDFKYYIGIEDGRALIAFFIAENEKIKEFVGPGQLNTDNKPLLEFELPKYFYFDYLQDWNFELLQRFRDKEDWLNKYFQIGNDDYMYYVLATAKLYQGFNREAYELVERGLLINQQSPYLLGLKAMIISGKNPQMAQELFGQALQLDPNNGLLYYRYAQLVLGGYSAEASLPLFRKAEELGYASKIFWLEYANALIGTKDYQGSIAILQKGLQDSGDLDYKYYEQIADAYLYLRNPQAALDNYKSAAEKNPYYSIVYARSADIYLNRGMFTVAESFFAKAIEIEPSRYTYYLKLAEVQKKLGRDASARESLYKAYLLTQNKLEVYNAAANLGIAFP